MWWISRKLIHKLYQLAYNQGVADVISKKTFRNTEEEANKWIKENYNEA